MLGQRWHQDEALGAPLDGSAAKPAAIETFPSKARPELDARFTYANERTFLASNRTALALLIATATQLLSKFQLASGRRLLGLPLIALAARRGCRELSALARQ